MTSSSARIDVLAGVGYWPPARMLHMNPERPRSVRAPLAGRVARSPVAVSVPDYGAVVSELLPNLDSLVSQLEHKSGAKTDALALAESARSASTVAELDEAVRTVIEGWTGL